MSFLKKLFSRNSREEQSAESEVPSNQPASNNKKQNKTQGKKNAGQSKSKKSSRKEKPPEVISLPEDFAVLDLPLPLQQAVQKLGFQNCTPVQNEV